MTNSFRDELYKRVKARVNKLFAREPETLGRCFWWTRFGLEELQNAGIKACIQAGTAYWPRLPLEEAANSDDGAFGFQWDPRSLLSNVSMLLGNLPECHVWLGVVSTQEIIDFATGDFPLLCQQQIGKDWPGKLPPQYLWVPASSLPDGSYYEPIADATIRVGRWMTTLPIS